MNPGGKFAWDESGEGEVREFLFDQGKSFRESRPKYECNGMTLTDLMKRRIFNNHERILELVQAADAIHNTAEVGTVHPQKQEQPPSPNFADVAASVFPEQPSLGSRPTDDVEIPGTPGGKVPAMERIARSGGFESTSSLSGVCFAYTGIFIFGVVASVLFRCLV